MVSSVPQGRFDFTQEVPFSESLGAVHFIAIGGAGVSGVARLFLAAGYRVSGSDQRDSPALRSLEESGARVFVGHDAAHVAAAETVIISGAIKESNPELVAARDQDLRVLHRAQGIAALLQDRSTIAVAGANGKTTTSAMLTSALLAADLDPGYVIGSPLAGGLGNAALGAGPVVVEADESDASFLVYRPDIAIVTNVTPDHLDFYGDFAGVQAAFAQFVGTISAGGLLVINADDAGSAPLVTLAKEQGLRVHTWGHAADADVRIESVDSVGMSSTAELLWQAQVGDASPGQRHTLNVPMPGAHNIANACAALVAATAGAGGDTRAALSGLASFPGADRRFQRVGEATGVSVVDDYAHNPDKVAAVVQAGLSVTRSTGGRLVVVFQPHLYSRTQHFVAQFAAGLAAADVVSVLDIYGAREEPIPGVTSQLITQAIADSGGATQVLDDVRELAQAPAQLAPLLRAGDLVLTVGAGDITTLGPRLVDALSGLATDQNGGATADD